MFKVGDKVVRKKEFRDYDWRLYFIEHCYVPDAVCKITHIHPVNKEWINIEHKYLRQKQGYLADRFELAQKLTLKDYLDD